MQNLTRITRNPEVMGGKPCIRGMHVTVGAVVGLLASGQFGRGRYSWSACLCGLAGTRNRSSKELGALRLTIYQAQMRVSKGGLCNKPKRSRKLM